MRIAANAGPDLPPRIGKLRACFHGAELALEEAPPAADRDLRNAAGIGCAGERGEFLQTARVGIARVAVAVGAAVFVEIGMADALRAEIAVDIDARVGMRDDAGLGLDAKERIGLPLALSVVSGSRTEP